jgi:hypothetical protein
VTTFASIASRWLAATVLVVAVGLLAVALLMKSPATSAGSPGDIPAAVKDALSARQTVMILPANLHAGSLTQADKDSLKSNVRAVLAPRWGGTALTNVLTNAFAWIDRVATNPTEGYALTFDLVSVQLDPPILANGAATVTGTYRFIAQQGYGLPDGRQATYGGTYTNRFTFELQHGDAGWYVSAYTDEPIGMEPNPSFESNLNVDPNPEATKPPLPGAPSGAP